ncbi:hypothetical protein ES705_30679 [subsurface metagenome]
MALYADITDLTLEKDEALPGEIVNFVVSLKNLFTSVVSMKMTGYFRYNNNTIPVVFIWEGINVQPGYTVYFAGNFVMPSSAGALFVWSWWYGGDGNWYADDGMGKAVGLAEAPPEEGAVQIESVNTYVIR